jgi:hypothetical protein
MGHVVRDIHTLLAKVQMGNALSDILGIFLIKHQLTKRATQFTDAVEAISISSNVVIVSFKLITDSLFLIIHGW